MKKIETEHHVFKYSVTFTRTGKKFPEHAPVYTDTTLILEIKKEVKREFNNGKELVYFNIDAISIFNPKTKKYEKKRY